MDLHDPHRHGERPWIRSSRDDAHARSPVRTGGSAQRTKHGEEIRQRLDALAGDSPVLRVDGLIAGYGSKAILRGIDLRLGPGQLLCLVGPSGAGKSTILHSIFGLTDICGGRIEVGGRNVTRLGPNAKLRDAGIACVLRDSSVFTDMTVEQNLWLGGYLMGRRADSRHATERVFDRYPSLATRRDEPASALSAGERRLLEISRALVMRPRLLLVDEPSIGLDACLHRQHFRDAARSARPRGAVDPDGRTERETRARARRHRLRRRLRGDRDGGHRRRAARRSRRRPPVLRRLGNL